MRAGVFLVAISLLGVQTNAEVAEECLAVETHFALNEIEALSNLELSEPRWQTLQQFRLAAAYVATDDRSAARKAIRRGLALVADQLKRTPDDVHLLLMGTMLDGQYLLLSPWRFLINGTRGLRRLRSAETIAPDDARIALVRGTAEVVLPRVFGGDAEAARQRFRLALQAELPGGDTFAASPLCGDGEWAQVDLLNWLGRAEAALGNSQAAEAAYREALDRSPDNYWVIVAARGEGYEWRQ